MLGSECDLKTCVRNLGYLLPYDSGVQNRLFRRLCNLTATLTAYICALIILRLWRYISHLLTYLLRNETDIHNMARALETTRSHLHYLETKAT